MFSCGGVLFRPGSPIVYALNDIDSRTQHACIHYLFHDIEYNVFAPDIVDGCLLKVRTRCAKTINIAKTGRNTKMFVHFSHAQFHQTITERLQSTEFYRLITYAFVHDNTSQLIAALK